MLVLRRLADIRVGELRHVAYAGLTLFTVIAAHTLLETARDALFLRALPTSRLAIVYAALAVLAMATVPVVGMLARRLGRRGALTATLITSALGTAAFAAAPTGGAQAMGLYLWTGLLATVVMVQFWLLAGELFTAGQSRRLLPPIAAAGALGAFAGAAFASILVEHVEVGQLLPVAAALFAGAAMTVRAIPATSGQPSRAATSEAAPAPSPASAPYLRRLAAIVAVSTAALLATDYLFKLTVASTIPADRLPVFLARYNAVITGLSLVIQIGGVGWLLRRKGALTALTIVPALIALGAVVILTTPAPLVGVLLAKGADGVLRHSLHRVSLELLWSPVPTAVRARTRERIDGVLVRAAQAVTAGALFALAPVVTPTILVVFVGALALVWLGLALAIRRPYVDQFRALLARPGRGAHPSVALDAAEPIHVVLERTLAEHLRVSAVDHALSSAPPTRSRESLRRSIRERRTISLARALLLLQIACPDEDLRGVGDALRAGTAAERATAHELLDLITRDAGWTSGAALRARALLLLLADPMEERVRLRRAAALIAMPPRGPHAILDLLAGGGDPDPTVAALARTLQRDLARRPPLPRAARLMAVGMLPHRFGAA